MICRLCRLLPASHGDTLCADCGETAAKYEFDGGFSRDEAEARTAQEMKSLILGTDAARR